VLSLTTPLIYFGIRPLSLGRLKNSDWIVAIVDDSLVRGTTSKQIVKMLKEAGATEVHMRSFYIYFF